MVSVHLTCANLLDLKQERKYQVHLVMELALEEDSW